MKLHPNNFVANETWIAIRINDSFIYVKDEPYDGHVLMDAGSCYIFGFVFCKTADIYPDEKEVEELFMKTWSLKSEWAKELIIPNNYPPGDIFAQEAKKHNMTIMNVDESDLDLIIGPLKESFEKDFLGSV